MSLYILVRYIYIAHPILHVFVFPRKHFSDKKSKRHWKFSTNFLNHSTFYQNRLYVSFATITIFEARFKLNFHKISYFRWTEEEKFNDLKKKWPFVVRITRIFACEYSVGNEVSFSQNVMKLWVYSSFAPSLSRRFS